MTIYAIPLCINLSHIFIPALPAGDSLRFLLNGGLNTPFCRYLTYSQAFWALRRGETYPMLWNSFFRDQRNSFPELFDLFFGIPLYLEQEFRSFHVYV